MPSADIVVVGAGLAGLTAGLTAVQAGARVQIFAKGHAATYWGPGGIDIAGIPAAATARDGIELLAQVPGHPYAFLGGEVEAALDWLRPILAAEGVDYAGTLDTALQPVPTSIGGTRRAAILPAGQAGAIGAWGPGERLVVCGIAGFKDFWPDAIAASLSRDHVWGESSRPASVTAVTATLPGLAGRHNLNALVIGRLFDDPTWRLEAIDAIAKAVSAARISGARVALPAVLGIKAHDTVLTELRQRLPGISFEMPLVPPSLPGMRLYSALRSAFMRAGGRIMIGETIERIEHQDGRVTAVATTAAARDHVVRTGALILATGGIAGGGLVAERDGRLIETVVGLPVEAPPADGWLAETAFDPAGHPIERAGVRTDDDLRPVDAAGLVLVDNIRIAGSLLAGQRYIRERCGDGVAITSGRHAAASLTRVPVGAAESGSVR